MPVSLGRAADTKLENGLRVILSEDHAAPVFAIVVNYNVGSRDDMRSLEIAKENHQRNFA